MLEQKLAAVHHATEEVSKTTKDLLLAAKKLLQSSETGDLTQLHRGVASLGTLIDRLKGMNADIASFLDFGAEAYLSSPAFLQELSDAAKTAGVATSLGENVLYSYPLAVTVQPQKASLLIGKRRVTRLRPTFVAQQLKQLQSETGRLSTTSFIETLYKGYNLLLQNNRLVAGAVIPLTSVYDVLTLLPQASRDYTKHDFSVDIYRLDKSNNHITKDGHRVSLPASTGTRATSGVLSIVSNTGASSRSKEKPDHFVEGLHRRSHECAGGRRFLHGGSAHVAWVGDPLRAVLPSSGKPLGLGGRDHQTSGSRVDGADRPQHHLAGR